jgi:glycosyltransferase involved in cell wall biosynthesis
VVRYCLRSPAWLRWRPGILWQRWALWRRLRGEHRQIPFDLIECADAWGWLPFAKLRGVPVVTRLHGAMFFFDHEMDRMTGDELTHWLERRSLARSDYVVAVSQYVAREEMKLSTVPDAPVQLIYNAVDTDFFSPAPNPAVEPGLIVFVNSIQYRKGVYELCEAMNIVARSHPEAHLVVIGTLSGTSRGGQPIREELMEIVRPEFRERVRILGWLETRQDVQAYLRKANVCCYPSRLECFGIAPAEAMAVGRPTIYSRFGPGPEVIVDGESGLLCDPANPADIAAKIQRVLDDPRLADALGREARKRALALFDKKNWIRQNLEFYQQCLNRKRH